MKLGFIGLGAMGLPMTRNLVAAGHQVTVASRSRPPVDEAMAFGAIDGGTITDVASSSEVLILCVPNSPDVVQVLDTVVPAIGPGTIVVDCSTIDPDVERAQHARVTATGARYLDAPVSGGTVGAKKGTLTLMVGGDEATLDDARPALDPMAGLIVHVGGPGDGPGREALQQPHLRGPDGGDIRGHRVGPAVGCRHGEAPRGPPPFDRGLHRGADPAPGARCHRRQPRLERMATRLHDRSDGEGPRPRLVLREPGPVCP